MIPVPDTSGAFTKNDDLNNNLTELSIAVWALVQRLDVVIKSTGEGRDW